MDKNEIFETVMDVVATAASKKPEEIDPDSRLIEDMGLDSLSIFEIVVDLEAAFNLFINDEIVDGLHTPREVANFLTERLNK
ncbi:MAG: acyl carrier protein [Fastidiosipilaceae bacterium]|jgi:acyl carrier protein|nr:acyl carrier protein [Clostridiaceae bacterium]